jgi:hypothetical protein
MFRMFGHFCLEIMEMDIIMMMGMSEYMMSRKEVSVLSGDTAYHLPAGTER